LTIRTRKRTSERRALRPPTACRTAGVNPAARWKETYGSAREGGGVAAGQEGVLADRGVQELRDLAVGVIIGAAFAKIIDSLVKNLIMPLLSVISPSEQSYTNWKWEIGSHAIPYGAFLGDVVNFLIVALALFFFIVKFLGWVLRVKKDAAPPPLTKDQELLTEIRDLLKKEKA
jgi:large conductance mechanosensitive channel